MVCQRVYNHRGILTGLNHFVKVTDSADTRRGRQWAILPPGTIAIQQETPQCNAMYSTKRDLPQPVEPSASLAYVNGIPPYKAQLHQLRLRSRVPV